MPAPLPVASPPDDGIIVEFTVGDVTMAPSGPYLRVTMTGQGSRLVETAWFEDAIRNGIFSDGK